MSYERTRANTLGGDAALQGRLPVGVAERDRRHAEAPRSGDRGDRQRAGERGDRHTDAASRRRSRTSAAVRGWSRTDARPPTIAPNAPHVETIPQSRAPPRCSREDHRAEHDERREAEVRDREADDRRAHPRARRHLAQPVAQLVQEACCAAARACGATRSCSRKNALATKLTESIANTQPGAGERDQHAGDRRAEDVHRVAARSRAARSPAAGSPALTVCGTRPSDGRPEERRRRAEERAP